MNECRYFMLGRCTILVDTVCSNSCSFRKTDDEWLQGKAEADAILSAKGLERCEKIDKNGQRIISTREKRCF